MRRFSVNLARWIARFATCALAVALFDASTATAIPQSESPGPSAALFAAPFYSCLRNFYVATNGDDANSGATEAPWRTLQRADWGRTAGDCINAAPGVYPRGVVIRNGGKRAEATGYVVYRCQQLDACKITANGGNAAPVFNLTSPNGPNYVVIDGFEMAAARHQIYASGLAIGDNAVGGPTVNHSAHHVWFMNNIVHGFGEEGIGIGRSDWTFILHNAVYDNSRATCDAQGSGISIVVPAVTPNYTPTADDLKWAPFHIVVAWNVVHDNQLMNCGNASNPSDTDGNGIIMDTFNGDGIDNQWYTAQSLVANNIAYDNGGAGIYIFRSSYITVANNTAYNNHLDPWDQGVPRGEIDNSGGFKNTFINNVALATPAADIADPRCMGANYGRGPARCPLMANVAFLAGNAGGVVNANNTFANNIFWNGSKLDIGGSDPKRIGVATFDADAYSCASNKCNVDPRLADPSGHNFGLSGDSPAIGYGQARDFLPDQDVDAGACHHGLTQCPR